MTINPITELQGVVARDIRDLILRIFEPPPGIIVSDLHGDPDMGSIVFTVTEQPSSEQMTVRITNTTGLIQSALLRTSVGSGRNKKSTQQRRAGGQSKNPAARTTGDPERERSRTVQPKPREVVTLVDLEAD